MRGGESKARGRDSIVPESISPISVRHCARLRTFGEDPSLWGKYQLCPRMACRCVVAYSGVRSVVEEEVWVPLQSPVRVLASRVGGLTGTLFLMKNGPDET